MINVCFFSGDITRSGGTERVATTIVNGLSKTKKYRLSILSIVEQRKKPFYPILPEVKRYVLKNDRKWLSPGVGYLPLIPVLRKFLKKYKVNIIIDIDIVLDALSLPATIGLNVRVFSWEHFHYYFEHNILYRRIIAWFSARFSDYMITLTERDKNNYQKKLHRKKRIVSISNPVEIAKDTVVPKEKVLITVGHLEHWKGTDMLAEIAPKILKKYSDWKWYFLGDGPYRDLLESARRKYGLEEKLILTGVVSNVEDYLRRASIMVMASRTEGLPMCLLEAKACAVPCISFDIMVGPSELIEHGRSGFLIPPFDLGEMIDRISQLIVDDNLRKRFSLAAQTGVEEYEVERILEKWIWLLDTVLR